MEAAVATGSDEPPAEKPKKKAAARKRTAAKTAAEPSADTGADTGQTTDSAAPAPEPDTQAPAAPMVLFQPPEKKAPPRKRTTRKVSAAPAADADPATAAATGTDERPSEPPSEPTDAEGAAAGGGKKQGGAKKKAAKKTGKKAGSQKSGSQKSGGQESGGQRTTRTRTSSGEDDRGPDAPQQDADDQDSNGDDNRDDSGDDSGDGEGGARRRRRRGGRRRRKPSDNAGSDGDSEDSDDAEDNDGPQGQDDSDDGEDSGGGPRRRRRRRRSGDDSGGGNGGSGGSDGSGNARARKPRNPEDEITSIGGSTRLEAKKQRRREGREAGRRRAPIVSEAEFLARRESVDRVMVIRQKDDLTQIGVLEDKVLVEHYVARESQTSLIGNVYLGRVQNVLPSMEAAFIDIGKGRNAVLYAGEVNWKAVGHKDGQPRKIESVLSSGQTILVQVSKDPVGHKGARLTGQVSLPGRFLVYVPDGNTSGISRKLPDTERNRLKTLLKEIVPDTAGVIVRTAAEGASEDELTLDVERLTARWTDIDQKVKDGKGPQLLYGEPDLTLKVVRDLFTEDFTKLVVQGDDAWDLVENYVSHVAPDLQERLERFEPDDSGKDLFATYRVDEQIAKGLDRKVWLPSGGSLVIDRTEAMTVVDVNTGKFTGSGGNLEETVTKNNLEAAEEIVRQLRLRDIGGIIVVDFIDMVLESNRDLVLRRLVECLGRDRTRHQVAEVTSLGLVQMTRKRIGTGLLEAFSTDCEACKGRGLVLHDHPIESNGRSEDDDSRGRRNRGGGGRSRGGRGGGNDGNGNGNGNGTATGTGPRRSRRLPTWPRPGPRRSPPTPTIGLRRRRRGDRDPGRGRRADRALAGLPACGGQRSDRDREADRAGPRAAGGAHRGGRPRDGCSRDGCSRSPCRRAGRVRAAEHGGGRTDRGPAPGDQHPPAHGATAGRTARRADVRGVCPVRRRSAIGGGPSVGPVSRARGGAGRAGCSDARTGTRSAGRRGRCGHPGEPWPTDPAADAEPGDGSSDEDTGDESGEDPSGASSLIHVPIKRKGSRKR